MFSGVCVNVSGEGGGSSEGHFQDNVYYLVDKCEQSPHA